MLLFIPAFSDVDIQIRYSVIIIQIFTGIACFSIYKTTSIVIQWSFHSNRYSVSYSGLLVIRYSNDYSVLLISHYSNDSFQLFIIHTRYSQDSFVICYSDYPSDFFVIQLISFSYYYSIIFQIIHRSCYSNNYSFYPLSSTIIHYFNASFELLIIQ